MLNKNVLMIAYIFPPLGGSGVQRTVKFVRYLPQFGWKPLVVCSDGSDIYGFGQDPTLLADIPSEACVWRTPFVSPYGLRRQVQHWLGMKPNMGILNKAVGSSSGGSAPAIAEPTVLRRVLHILSKPLRPLEFPPVDAALYWALSIIPLCHRIIVDANIDLIYTTSFPYSDHVAGFILKRITGKPWVADFRDPWTQHAAGGNRGWRWRCDVFVEQRVLNYADTVIGCTPTYTQNLAGLAPSRPSSNFITIENGFDPTDFERAEIDQIVRVKQDGMTTVAHVGVVYDGTGLPFLEALKRLGAEEKARLRILFVGGLKVQERRWLRDHALNLQVEVMARVSHPVAIEHMRTADVVLLPIGSGPKWKGHCPGKLFEYMNCGTPILMVGPEGDAAELVRASGTGCFVPAHDVDAVAEVLRLLATQPQEFRARYYRPKSEVVARYERRALAQRLAAVFDELVAEKANND